LLKYQNFLQNYSLFSNFLHNYFGLTKLFSNMYLAKFLDQQNRFFRNSVKKGKRIKEKGNRKSIERSV